MAARFTPAAAMICRSEVASYPFSPNKRSAVSKILALVSLIRMIQSNDLIIRLKHAVSRTFGDLIPVYENKGLPAAAVCLLNRRVASCRIAAVVLIGSVVYSSDQPAASGSITPHGKRNQHASSSSRTTSCLLSVPG